MKIKFGSKSKKITFRRKGIMVTAELTGHLSTKILSVKRQRLLQARETIRDATIKVTMQVRRQNNLQNSPHHNLVW
jgi:hypothetical protein